jgi:cell division protease FtsH
VTREQLEARLVMAYGGRAAEEIVFGHGRVTTGAASDIQQATSIARRYVTQWGLSDAIGPILVGDNEQELFLGREIQSRREVSEQTAQAVDAEVKRVAFEAHARAVSVLTEHRALLDQVATQLLERETLTRDDILLLKEGKELPPRPTDTPSVPPAVPPAAPLAPRPSAPPFLGGPEVAPA